MINSEVGCYQAARPALAVLLDRPIGRPNDTRPVETAQDVAAYFRYSLVT